MLDIQSLFSYWEDAGIFDFFLPFILIFCLIFAILERIKMFGDNKKSIHMVIALAFALLAANSVYVREILHQFLPNVAFFMVVILAFILLISTMFGEAKFFQGTSGWLAVIIVSAFIIWSLIAENVGDFYQLPSMLSWLGDITSQDLYTILFVGVFVVIIVMFMKGDAKKPEKEEKK